MLPRNFLLLLYYILILFTAKCSFVDQLPPHQSQRQVFTNRIVMATRDKDPPPAEFTTNEEDQREAAKLQARLKNHTTASSSSSKGGKPPLPSVEIAQGAHKYVLIRAQYNGKTQFIVTSKKGAHYHRNAAEPMIFKLEEAGYSDIEVEGGGRIFLDEKEKKISVFGHSYGFGQANHAVSQMVIKSDKRYKDFDITISDEGY